MKTTAIFVLVISLALNGVCAIALLRERPARSLSATTTLEAPRGERAAPTLAAETWSGLQAGELKELKAWLEAEEFPPAMVQAVLAAQIREMFAARRKAISGEADGGAFWRDGRDPKAAVALVQLEREQRAMLRDVLGREPEDASSAYALHRHRNLSFLPDEKAGEVRRLLRDLDERRSELYAGGYSPATDAQKMKALEAEHQAALAAVLTPAELAEYTVRQGRTAETLRDELSAFGPTEQEFRAIHALRLAYDERHGREGIVMVGDERYAAQKQMVEQIKLALGPERGAEYERKTDFNYRRTSQLVSRLGLPAETAEQVWAIQKDMEKQRADLYATRPDRAAATERMTAMQKDGTARIGALLGQAGLEAYHQYGGSWLQSWVPRPAAPAKK